MRSIQKSIFTVCLDRPVPRVSEDVYRNHVAGQMLHGGGGALNSGNRWFDKTLQVGRPGGCLGRAAAALLCSAPKAGGKQQVGRAVMTGPLSPALSHVRGCLGSDTTIAYCARDWGDRKMPQCRPLSSGRTVKARLLTDGSCC